MNPVKETPLMKQYALFKKKYPGAILLFRVGDFYETFGDDAIKASKILSITLTKRSNGGVADMPLAGFPHHSLDTYLPKLVRAGERVAICDQLEDPKLSKGLVKRGVTELITPGVSMNDNVLESKRNNYLAAVHFVKDKSTSIANSSLIGLSFLDISTGEFLTSQGNFEYIGKLLQSFAPAEVLVAKPFKKEFLDTFGNEFNTFFLEDWAFAKDFGYQKITTHFNISTLKGFGIENLDAGIAAAGAVLQYLSDTEHNQISHIATLGRLEEDKYVWLDRFTIRNLELLQPQQDNGVPLIRIMDVCQTSMGGRLLRKWVVLPLKEKEKIEERLSIVEDLMTNKDFSSQLLDILSEIGDLERLVSKVAACRINPRETSTLKRTLANVGRIQQSFNHFFGEDSDHFKVQNKLPSLERGAGGGFTNSYLQKIFANFKNCQELITEIDKVLKDDAPVLSNQGRMIREGNDTELDELHNLLNTSKEYLETVLEREIANTGINSLKIQYNRVHGYYIEVSNANKNKVPADWIRRQTLTGAERYITEELKIYEEKIFTAEDQINVIEQRLYNVLVERCAQFVAPIQHNARLIATIDCLLCFAQIALKNSYVRPVILEDNKINIKDGRHPVIERQLPIGEPYIPNDTYLDNTTQQIIIVTGPNMAGKSALLRQVALITLMAQMGSFVPATYAEIGLVDKVFTRVGASDNLSKGESTFMVEMMETASIMNNISAKSLILMDEIGRGTSTYDGISIAWSILEYLHNHPYAKAKTLFATHYHELNELTHDFERIKNFNVSVKDVNNKIVFMRKLKAGGSEHSFGIHVAQMAGMPKEIVARANEILVTLENSKSHEEHTEKLKNMPKNEEKLFQMKMFDAYNPNFEKLKEILQSIDLNITTPMEAMMKLSEMKKVLDK